MANIYRKDNVFEKVEKNTAQCRKKFKIAK